MVDQNLQIATQGIDPTTHFNTWALPEGAIARFGKGRANDALAFSPDGKYLAVGTWVGVWWYDVSTLSPIALWETGRGAIDRLNFSPDGKHIIISNYDGVTKVFDVSSGICVSQTERRVTPCALAFSPNNQHFATSHRHVGSFDLWQADTGEQLARLSPELDIKFKKAKRSEKCPLCFSPDGQLLAHACPVDVDGAADFILVWDMNTFEPITSIKDYTTRVDTLAFSPCSKFLAVGDASGTLKEWDIITKQPTGKQIKTSSNYPRGYQVIPSYTQSGQLRAACGSGAKVILWNIDDSEKIDEFDHDWYINHYHFLNGTHLIIRNSVKVWIEGTSNRGTILPGFSNVGYSPVFSPDGKKLVSIRLGSYSAHIWDVLDKREDYWVYDEEKSMIQVYFSPDGSIHARGNMRNANTGVVWNIQTNETIKTFPKPDTRITASKADPLTGNCAFGDLEGNCYLYTGEETAKILSGHTGAIKALAFSTNGEQLASTSEKDAAYLWDVASGEKITSLSTDHVLDANLYTGDPDQLQTRLRTLQYVSTNPSKSTVEAIVFSPRGDLIAGGIGSEIRLWHAKTHEVQLVIIPPRTCLRCFALAFTPCGRYIVSGSWWRATDKVSIRFWDVASGENIKTLWSHSTDVQELSFSPDGTLLASGSYDGTILLWDVKSYLKNA